MTHGRSKQCFSLLSQQNFVNTLPNPNSYIEPIFSPNHDLILVPNHHSSQEKSVTMAHLQKPLFRENLAGPFSFRPDGLLINSGGEGIMMDQERRKWRGGVGTSIWLELDCFTEDKSRELIENGMDNPVGNRINNRIGNELGIVPNQRSAFNHNNFNNFNNFNNSSDSRNDIFSFDKSQFEGRELGSISLSQLFQSGRNHQSDHPSIDQRREEFYTHMNNLNNNQERDQNKEGSYLDETISASSLLEPLYALYDHSEYLTMLSSHASRNPINFSKMILSHDIDSDMERLVPDDQSYMMILYHNNLITFKMYGWVEIATFTIEENDFYPNHRFTAYQEGQCIRISFAEIGEYGIIINPVKLNFERLVSIKDMNRLSKHLSHMQYILLDKLPKVLEYIESIWSSFFSGFKKNIIDTYDSAIRISSYNRENQFKDKSPFITTFIELLINGECLHWDVHKEWLTSHANEKNLLKLIRSLNSTKTTILSYIVNYVEVYIKHSIYYLSTIRGIILYQKILFGKEILSESICTNMIESLKEIYAKTTELSHNFSMIHSDLLNLLSFLLIHQGKSLATDQKYTLPEGISANFDNFKLTQFLLSFLGEDSLFDNINQYQETHYQNNSIPSSPLARKIMKPLPKEILDPLRKYFSLEGGLKLIQQELIVKLSSLIEKFSQYISQGITKEKNLVIPTYEPSNVIGFTYKQNFYWAFFASEKWICLKLDSFGHISISAFALNEKAIQFKFYKVDPSNNHLQFIFLTETENQECFIRLTTIKDEFFFPCEEINDITTIVDSTSEYLTFSKSRECESQVSQISVGIRGLCAVFGKNQFWIYDLEGEDSDEEEEDEENQNEESDENEMDED